MPSVTSRIVGALMALHAADSLGSTYEFQPHAEIPHPLPNTVLSGGGVFKWKPGAATDDTDLTRAILLAYHGLLTGKTFKHGYSVIKASAEHMLAWYVGDWPGRKPGSPPVDVGGATQDSLERYKKHRDMNSSGDGKGSAGNGSLMRCLPTGLFQRDKRLLISESKRISAITHDDDKCKISCAAYNMIVRALVLGESPQEAVRQGEKVAIELEKGQTGPVYSALRLGWEISLPKLAKLGPEGTFPGGCSGYVLETLTLAIAAVLDKRGMEAIISDIVCVGKDTDTNAAVAGGLLGARDGEEAVPRHWRDTIQYGKEFRHLAHEMLKAQKWDK
ncbi:ADP-ribosylation/Crystallin J1 [Emericellopsis atlantica]|uniref:ADP-ribosylhydrolase ARH3 n=1 Tax=Emericellopsis atlantica TaxID=2614577 RepID=A0A9P7ZHH8_9HYPO|nr:ADP-ribosylation/Crystallin J1 [Emericellopsis atlantica]KAG9252174.1 ADP-ribosylation/Crystallin J1 [Emericellopsis atlantica]